MESPTGVSRNRVLSCAVDGVGFARATELEDEYASRDSASMSETYVSEKMTSYCNSLSVKGTSGINVDKNDYLWECKEVIMDAEDTWTAIYKTGCRQQNHSLPHALKKRIWWDSRSGIGGRPSSAQDKPKFNIPLVSYIRVLRYSTKVT